MGWVREVRVEGIARMGVGGLARMGVGGIARIGVGGFCVDILFFDGWTGDGGRAWSWLWSTFELFDALDLVARI